MIPVDSFLLEQKCVRDKVLAEIVGEELGSWGPVWNWFTGIDVFFCSFAIVAAEPLLEVAGSWRSLA